MFCPKCNSDKTSVTDSRSDGGAIRRRRECQVCDYRFTTYERVEFSLPIVVKKDGRRETFDREKVRSGFRRACEKRPVSTEAIDEAVEIVEKYMQELCVKEVDSRAVGEAVMDQLRIMDKIAYVRFASVYREFSDVAQFVDALQSLDNGAESHTPSATDGEVPSNNGADNLQHRSEKGSSSSVRLGSELPSFSKVVGG
jgi:transcriptional repressor NrdR